MVADDWLVADSEDEDVFGLSPPVDGSRASATTRFAVPGDLTPSSEVIPTGLFSADQPRTPQQGCQSPLRLANESLFTPPSGGMDSSIGNFTNAPLTPGAPLEVYPKPRPRPRVVIKKAVTSDHNTEVASTLFSHISDPPISTAGRTNDSNQPVTTTSFGLSEAVDDVYSSFGIAERAKMRSRKSQTAKKPTYSAYQMNEVIELTSDEDELTLKSTKRQKKQENPAPKPKVRTKPRPKPTLKVKPVVVPPSGSPPSQTATGDIQPPPSQCAFPPQPSAPTLPTIPPSTSPQACELTPLSSPPVTIRRRKRIRPSIVEDEEEVDTTGNNHAEASPSFTQPPPLFALSSSSVPTDSGIDIPPVELLSGRGRKKELLSSKKGTQTKTRNKGKKSKEVEITGATDETDEEFTRIDQEPLTTSAEHTSSFVKEYHLPVAEGSAATKKPSRKQIVMKKGKARAIDSCEEEDEPVPPTKSDTARTPPVSEREGQGSEENLRPYNLGPSRRDPPLECTSTSGLQVGGASIKPKLAPMSELIRRVNSQPSSPFPNASRAYSPFFKSSRTMLSRIAPLHPNRRTPPPPMPRPPPPKKSKKQLEIEERIEEELGETIEGWSCLTDEERKALRKARMDAEMGYE